MSATADVKCGHCGGAGTRRVLNPALIESVRVQLQMSYREFAKALGMRDHRKAWELCQGKRHAEPASDTARHLSKLLESLAKGVR